MQKISLIIPDLHHRWHQAEKIISTVGADDIIFLGDYFDDFDDDAEMVRDTSEWLIESVKKPNRIHLFGNHDQHYAFPYRSFRCSGYEEWKYFIIHDLVTKATWEKLKWYHVLEEKWLLSHAGLHKLNVPQDILALHTDRPKFFAELTQWLDVEIQNCLRKAANNETSWVFNAGRARWGQQRVGGITWCDYEREFYPILGLNQILGHTPQTPCPRWHVSVQDGLKDKISRHTAMLFDPQPEGLDDVTKSFNIDLDVQGNTHYGIWDGKTLKIGNYKDL